MSSLRRSLLALVPVAVLALAGCSVPVADGPTTDVSLNVDNRADTTYEVRIAVVPDGFEAVDVTYRNGSTRRLLVSEASAIRSSALANATNVTVVGPDVANRAFRLAPNSGSATVYEALPTTVSVVYAAWQSDADRIRNYGAFSCSTSTDSFEASLTLYPEGNVDSAVTCRGPRTGVARHSPEPP